VSRRVGGGMNGVLTAFIAASLIMAAASLDSEARQEQQTLRPRRSIRAKLLNPGVGPEFRRQDALNESTGPTLSVRLQGALPRRLVVVPQCGMGDRLMALSRAENLARRLDGAQLFLNWYPAGDIRMTAEMAFDPFTLPPSFAMASLRQRADVGVYGSCLPAAHCRERMRALFPNSTSQHFPTKRWLAGQGGQPAGYKTYRVSAVVECRKGDSSLYTRRESNPRFSLALHDLAPSPAVAATLRRVETQLGLGTSGGIGGAGARRVALHFRGSDKLSCFSDIRLQTIWRAFVDLVEREIQGTAEETVFFLATDDPTVASRLQAELPASAVIRTRKDIVRGRDSEVGLADFERWSSIE